VILPGLSPTTASLAGWAGARERQGGTPGVRNVRIVLEPGLLRNPHLTVPMMVEEAEALAEGARFHESEKRVSPTRGQWTHVPNSSVPVDGVPHVTRKRNTYRMQVAHARPDLLTLSDEVLLAVVCHIPTPPDHALAAPVTCRRLRRLSDDGAVWQAIASRVSHKPQWALAFGAALNAPNVPHGLAQLLRSTVIRARVYSSIRNRPRPRTPPMPELKLNEVPSRTGIRRTRPDASGTLAAEQSSVGPRRAWTRRMPFTYGISQKERRQPTATSCTPHDLSGGLDIVAQALWRTLDIRLLVMALHEKITRQSEGVLRVPTGVFGPSTLSGSSGEPNINLTVFIPAWLLSGFAPRKNEGIVEQPINLLIHVVSR
jgi:hypothetical protein